MKIISKFKDYYDYLKGIYGEDPKLILERVNEISPTIRFQDLTVLTFIIGGKLIQIYYNGEHFYFGEDLKQFDESTKYRKKKGHYTLPIGYINGRKNNMYVADSVKEGFDYINEKYKCPVLYRSDSWYCNDVSEKDFMAFPYLASTPITRFIPAEDVYKWLSEYIARQLDKSLEVIPNQTDVQKLENKGFDKINSFRPNIKQ